MPSINHIKSCCFCKLLPRWKMNAIYQEDTQEDAWLPFLCSYPSRAGVFTSELVHDTKDPDTIPGILPNEMYFQRDFKFGVEPLEEEHWIAQGKPINILVPSRNYKPAITFQAVLVHFLLLHICKQHVTFGGLSSTVCLWRGCSSSEHLQHHSQ